MLGPARCRASCSSLSERSGAELGLILLLQLVGVTGRLLCCSTGNSSVNSRQHEKPVRSHGLSPL